MNLPNSIQALRRFERKCLTERRNWMNFEKKSTQKKTGSLRISVKNLVLRTSDNTRSDRTNRVKKRTTEGLNLKLKETRSSPDWITRDQRTLRDMLIDGKKQLKKRRRICPKPGKLRRER